MTGFLESISSQNYARAEEYLDLRGIPAKTRAERGVELAKDLEQVLNSASQFNALELSLRPEGNLGDDSDPNIENVATVRAGNENFTLTLERVQLQPAGPLLWLFSPATVAGIPNLVPVSTRSAIEAHLPQFLVSLKILETPLWKWLALLASGALVILLFRMTVQLALYLTERILHRKRGMRWPWARAIVQPVLVMLSAALFRLAQEFIDPSAISRLYIGRAILSVVVGSIAWCLINLVEIFLRRVDSFLDPRQRVVSHSLIYLSRRAARVMIVVFSAILVLNNWGFNMNTIIAGLGVGGIAVALAAQQTIANVFGGVSVIGDHPVMVGDFGSFGGLQGTVEDIGMRSTRIRTLTRTVVSIPNSNFASINLENFSLRDKILFNPTFQVKRETSKEQLTNCMKALEELFKEDPRVEVGVSPIRISGLTAASFAVEVFAYVLTPDIDRFYKVEADLFVSINEMFAQQKVELV